jgi:hypothetical protein
VNTTVHPLVEGYLRSLDGAARVLPRRERDELVAQIRAHFDEALPSGATEADVRNTLDSLGAPWDIVAAAGPGRMPVRRGAREVFALLLLVTGVPPVIGWFVGLGLLIWSPLWTPRQKWLGALVWPGGWLGMLIVVSTPLSFSAHPCNSAQTPLSPNGSTTVTTGCLSSHSVGPWVWLPVFAVGVGLPILVATYLWRAAGRRSAA